VTAPDLPGHGASPRTGPEQTIKALADAVERSLADEPVDLLVGHSLGAVVALELAARAPDRAHRLVIEEPPGPKSIDGAVMADELERNAREARRDPRGQLSQIRDAYPRWDDGDCQQAVQDLIACDDAYAASGLRRCGDWRTIPLASDITIPVLVLLAPDSDGRYEDREDGSAIRGAERQEFLEALGDADVRVLATGHCVHRDDPGAWIAAVSGFASANRAEMGD
jgi:pimeloyl-ACP methyl ester carboxylesterase